ncbi:1-phosphatidylinositol--bisphosphate phosphodiesterase gamma 2 [Moniliophthora roreri]|nr:1-phosphatidylinositol--bisphosphate phosphodiesterase gamma 2 [Moniliophthora roreri]
MLELLLNKFVSPCLLHNPDHLRLAFCRDMALQTNKNRPVSRVYGVTYSYADTLESDAFAKGVPEAADERPTSWRQRRWNEIVNCVDTKLIFKLVLPFFILSIGHRG